MTEDEIKKLGKNNLIFFNEALEYLDDFDYTKPDKSTKSSQRRSNLLRDEMLEGLNHLKEELINNPDLKLESLNTEEKKLFFNFIKYYSICPICKKTNHHFNLKKFYFNEKMDNIREILVQFMNNNNSKLSKLNINFGIPCCSCYKKYLEEF
ncbi:MAG: hypothetical protein ACFFDX_09210 [Candidatus Odinarchaeota archaeon]